MDQDARRKFFSLLAACVVGAAFGVLMFFEIGLISWLVIHDWSDIGVALYFAVWLVGPPIVAILAGWVTYRELRTRFARPKAE